MRQDFRRRRCRRTNHLSPCMLVANHPQEPPNRRSFKEVGNFVKEMKNNMTRDNELNDVDS